MDKQNIFWELFKQVRNEVADNLELLQKEIHAKYGNFTTISSTELI